MARNKFDVDEVLETPFDIRHLKRSLVYAAKYKKRIAISLILSALGSVIGLLSPLIVQNAIDNYMIPVFRRGTGRPREVHHTERSGGSGMHYRERYICEDTFGDDD